MLRPWEVPLGILGGDRCAAPNPISDQKMSFSHQFSGLASIIHAHSQTWPLRNYVIIKIHFELAYFSFLLTHLEHSEAHQMEPPSPIQALGVNPLMGSWNTAVVPSKTIPDCIPNGAKSIPVFRPKRRKNPTLWGVTYLYGLYKGVPNPTPSPAHERESNEAKTGNTPF